MVIHWKRLSTQLVLSLLLAPVITAAQTPDKIIDPAELAKATAGDPASQTDIGISYEYGDGTPKDYAEAIVWYRKAAEQGYARAQYRLGEIYHYGRGVPKDYAQAADWYQKAALQNYSEAQLDLGLLYSQGLGVTKDTKKAFELFKQAGELGESDAQYRVALAYDNGQDVQQDKKLAAEWYLKSADQGFAGAQFNYAMICIGSKNYADGYYWLSLAADTLKGQPLEVTIKARDACAAQLNGSKRKKIDELIEMWRTAHPGKHY